MPRRNLLILLTVTCAALLCYQRVQKSPYGRVLAEAMGIIESRYLEPVPESVLFERAMEGMVGDLDENSAYITPEALQDFHESLDMQFEGIGLEVVLDPETKRLKVLCPLAGSPAYRAGVLAGDLILRIDGDSTQGMSLRDAVGLMRGRPGTTVTLTVERPGQTAPVEIAIVRGKIQVDSLRGDARNPDGSWNYFLEGYDRIGYIRLDGFTDQTADELKKALKWLSARSMRALVLDLRDDPGGYLGAAIDVCDQFLRSGVIVTVRRRGGQIDQTYTASGDGPATDVPIAVLVNDKSANAAEIVAACLQDHQRAKVFGQRTFGKGTVQEIIELDKGCGAMKITTASYWRPNGRNIHRRQDAGAEDDWGDSPDEGCAVELTEDEQNAWRRWRAARDGYSSNSNSQLGLDRNGETPLIDQPLQKAATHLEQTLAEKTRGETPEGRDP